MVKHRRHLQLRFMLAVLVSAVVFAGIAGALVYWLAHRQAIAAGQRSLEDLLRVVEKTAAAGAYADDRLLLEEAVDSLASNALTARAQVHTTRGVTITRGRLAADTGPRPGQMTVRRTLTLPFRGAEVVGELHIDADMEALGAAARRQATTMAMAMVSQIALIALVLYVAAYRLVSRPIVRMAQRLRAMEPGTSDRLRQPPGHENDEIGELVDGANALLAAQEAALDRERALRAEVEAMEAQYREIFDTSSAAIFVLDASGRLINGNATLFSMTGATLDRAAPPGAMAFLEQVFAQPARAQALVDGATRQHETKAADLQLRVADGGRERWVHCLLSSRSPTADAAGLTEGVMYDITERKRAEHAVRHQAEHDALTGLKNRAAGEAAVDRLLDEAALIDADVALLFVDLDGFKDVNDALGHKAGDQVLRHVARRLEASARRSADIVCRLGGDEFLIALHRCRSDDGFLSEVAADMVRALCEPVSLGSGKSARVGASVGIACYPRHGRTRRELAHCADQAMYAVKRNGKNTFAMALREREAVTTV